MQKPRGPDKRENLGMQNPNGLITTNKTRKIVGMQKPRPHGSPFCWDLGFRI